MDETVIRQKYCTRVSTSGNKIERICRSTAEGCCIRRIFRHLWYTVGMSKIKTLELAMSKVAALPEAAQEQIGRDVLLRVESLAALRRKLEVGIEQLDAGEGQELDIDDVKRAIRHQHENA